MAGSTSDKARETVRTAASPAKTTLLAEPPSPSTSAAVGISAFTLSKVYWTPIKLTSYGGEEKLNSDARRWEDLQSGVNDTLRHSPYLKQQRLQDIPADNVKEQKRFCKQVLFFHHAAPFKSYLKSQRKLSSLAIDSPALLLPGHPLTTQTWKVYFIAKNVSNPLEEHAMLAWEGIHNYGQRVIKMAHLHTVTRGQGIFAKKQLVISYFPFDVTRLDSFFTYFRIADFSVSKKRVREMETLISRDEGEIPGKYKMLLSGSGSSSKEEQQMLITNCQKWALEKLEDCLEMKLQSHMAARPSQTAAALQTLEQAKRAVRTEEKAEKKDSGCVVMYN